MADTMVLRALRGRARILNLNGKRLLRVPGAVGSLTLLTVLQLKNNLLSQLPEELTVLNLGNNSFEKVPEQLKHLKSLQRLHLFGNKITEIPPAVFDGLENLISLNLNNNLLKQLPSEIRNLQLLENLSVNHNQLKEVPKELCTLQHLCELHLTNNHLETLPEELGYMTNLKELLVSRNKLIGLPEGLGKLKKLKILDVAGNEIRTFPSTIHDVPLQKFYYEENPLLQKKPVCAVQEEEVLSLKEITARLILSHLKSTDSVLREKIKEHPKVRTILSNTNVCALCGQEFLDIWLECVKFVDVKKLSCGTTIAIDSSLKMKKSSNLQLLPIRVLLCSYKCFNQQHNGIFGVAIQ
ncbi:leucine-rich repeat-containing protein 69 isoform X2 [Ascaphus truei]|uniref:leucine-rich repeat-containing protein 69 isoform X2 n=1 Tax=Ascaphus truei TaxID=8439 RepID=UPI003F5A1A02